jgi:hypothetical protein
METTKSAANALGYPQRIESCEGRRHLQLAHVVPIQIYETQLAVPQLRFKAGLSGNEIRVSLVARSFRNNHGFRPEREENVGRGADQERVGVDFRSGDVLDQIGLEQDGFAAQLQPEQSQAVLDLLLQGSRVGVGVKDRHSGLRPAAVTYTTGCSHSLDAENSCAG